MNWQEVRVLISNEAEEAVAQLLLDFGAAGVAVDDPVLTTGGWDYSDLPVKAADSTRMVTVSAYYPEGEGDLAASVKAAVRGLPSFGLDPGRWRVDTRLVREEDWADNWKSYYHTLDIGKTLRIRPEWERTGDEGRVTVVLDPGMAFGTGTHPTTRMCLELLEEEVREGMLVYDIGTGSGILAIAALKLGAAEAIAVDTDPVAVKMAQRNAALNGLRLDVRPGGVDVLPTCRAGLVVANIVADVILGLVSPVRERLLPRGRFIASGIIGSRAGEVRERLEASGFAVLDEKTDGEWASFLAERTD